jgi:hypothetical protein
MSIGRKELLLFPKPNYPKLFDPKEYTYPPASVRARV